MNTDVESIVIVKLGGWADTIAANFMSPALKEKFPKAHVTLVLGESLKDWAGALQFDEVILVNDRALYSSHKLVRGVEMMRLALKLRQKKYDLGLSLHPDSAFGALLKFGGVKKTVGFVSGQTRLRSGSENPERSRTDQPSDYQGRRPGSSPDSRQNHYRNLFRVGRFDHEVELKPGVSQIDNYLSVLAAVAVVPLKLNFKLRVRQSVHDEVMKRLAFDGLRAQGYLAVGIGAGVGGIQNSHRHFSHKRWPYMAEFIRLFCEKTGLPILLLGGPNDRDLVPALTFVNHERIKSWVGSTTREEALAVISQAVAFVGCDSGLAHVAGSVGVPSVVLYGPSSSKVSHPPGINKTVLCLDAMVPCSPCAVADGSYNWSCRDNVCMKANSPQQVWRALKQIAQFPDVK